MAETVASPECWEYYAELIHSYGIEDADSRGFTVRAGDVSIRIDPPSGLTETLYNAVAPLLSIDNRPVLAIGVLRNLVCTRIDWEHLLVQKYGPDVDERLTTVAESKGFDYVADLIRKMVIDYRKKAPPARTYLSVVSLGQEDAGKECKVLRDELREIKQMTEKLVRQHEAGAETTSLVQPPVVEGWRSPFRFQEDGVIYEKVHYPLTEKQIAILRRLDEAKGNWISSTEMGSPKSVLWAERIDRHIKKLPTVLRELVEGETGKGYRLVLPQKT